MTTPERRDIDVRFLLANERTLLAWVRTALTLQAGGVALAQLGDRHRILLPIGGALLILGGVAAAVGYARYRAADAAIRSDRLPARGRGPVLVTGGVIALAALLIIGYALDLLR